MNTLKASVEVRPRLLDQLPSHKRTLRGMARRKHSIKRRWLMMAQTGAGLGSRVSSLPERMTTDVPEKEPGVPGVHRPSGGRTQRGVDEEFAFDAWGAVGGQAARLTRLRSTARHQETARQSLWPRGSSGHQTRAYHEPPSAGAARTTKRILPKDPWTP